jgi:heptosyltransferase-1
MVCCGSNWENKKLSFHQLEAFLRKIHRMCGVEFWFVVGSKEDAADAKLLTSELEAKTKIFEKPSWSAWIELMQGVDSVISSDSCALHLAGFFEVPSFSFFGPSNELVYKPFGNLHSSIQGSCPYGQNFLKRCKTLRTCSTGACLKNIDPQDLFQKFNEFYQS